MGRGEASFAKITFAQPVFVSMTDALNEDIFVIEPVEDQVYLISENARPLAQFVPFACSARMLGEEREHMFEPVMIALGLFDSEIGGTGEEYLDHILFGRLAEPIRHRGSRPRAAERRRESPPSSGC